MTALPLYVYNTPCYNYEPAPYSRKQLPTDLMNGRRNTTEG